jgi:hypothetical protein
MAKEETKVASENEENEVAERQATQTESENMEPDAVSDNKTLKVEHKRKDDRIVGAVDEVSEEMPGEDDQNDMVFNIAAEVTKLLVQNGIYEKRRVFRATDEQRREMYGQKERVVTKHGDHVVTAEDELAHEYDILLNAARSIPKKIVYGTIVGVCDDENSSLCALVNLDDTKGYYRILIPALELFPLELADYTNNPNGLVYLKNELRARIGGHIGLTIYDLHENDRMAYGSAVEAMSIEAYRWYRKKTADGTPEMVNGLRAQAEIVAVRRDRVRVNVLGAETTILSRDMSWLSLGVLTDEFRIGQRFAVRVDNIQEKEYFGAVGADGKRRRYILISITASKKAAEPNPAEMYYDFFAIGDLSAGVIKNVTETGVFVNLQNKMDCLCPHPVSGVAAKNHACVVRIERKNDENKFISGIIVSLS